MWWSFLVPGATRDDLGRRGERPQAALSCRDVRETNVRSVVDGQFQRDGINVSFWHFPVTRGNADQKKAKVKPARMQREFKAVPRFLGPHWNPFCMTKCEALAEKGWSSERIRTMLGTLSIAVS
ncbi:MAG: hypothetical protein WCD57_24355, partial [Acidobacteriaceae bacterium]